MISFVCWKWQVPGGSRMFRVKHVNALRAMIARHYAHPFRMICITDDAADLDSRIEVLPLPARFDQLVSPQGERFPNCYCRLWNFSREAVAMLGERIFQIDIDVIITGDLTPLVDRDEDFVGWCDKRFQKNKIAGGAYLLRTGSLPEIWDDFDPTISPASAAAAGYEFGSDQGWISYKLANRTIGKWNGGSGLMKINWTPANLRTTPASRIVFTNGLNPPWSRQMQAKYPWLAEHWRAA